MVLLLLAETSVVDAEGLGGPAFENPGIVWRSVPSDWIERPVSPEAELQEADLVISLDQQLYPYLLPLIQDYGTTRGLTIAVSKGTCGISGGLLFRKAVDIGGFCCAPADTDRLPGLRFHTLAIAAIALFVHPDNPIEDLTLSQARGLFRGEITDWSSLVAPSSRLTKHPVHPIGRLHCKLRPGHWRLLLDRVYNVTTWEGVAARPFAAELVHHLQEHVQELDSRFLMVPFDRLQALGWKFEGDELVGEPE